MIDDMLLGRRNAMQFALEVGTYFREWNRQKGTRLGQHVSSMIVPDEEYCPREQVFNRYFEAREIPVDDARIRDWYVGWAIHTGYQRLFKQMHVSVEIEETHIDPRWDLYYTPDAILKMLDELYIFELKTMRSRIFESHLLENQPPLAAVLQSQMYMFLTHIEKAAILLHNKNTSEYKVFIEEADYEKIDFVIDRLNKNMKYFSIFETQERMPVRHEKCHHELSPRAKVCPFGHICFLHKDKRMEHRREKVETLPQINASFIHDIEAES